MAIIYTLLKYFLLKFWIERPCHNDMSRDKEKLDVNNRMRGLCLRKIAPTAANR